MSASRPGEPVSGALQEALSSLVIPCQEADVSGGIYPTAEPYGGYELPPHYRPDHSKAFAAARDYLASVIPGISVEPLSNVGTNAIVMQDSTSAYKVMRNERIHYPKVENEAATLTLLSKEGITPRLHLLVDAARERRVSTLDRYRGIQTEGLRIPRTESAGSLAVLVTEKRDIGNITELPEAGVGIEFNKFASAALNHRLLYEDCRFYYDRKNGSAVVVDVGEVCAAPAQYPDAYVVHNTLIRFLGSYVTQPSYQQTEDVLAGTNDLDRLHSLLLEYRGTVPKMH